MFKLIRFNLDNSFDVVNKQFEVKNKNKISSSSKYKEYTNNNVIPKTSKNCNLKNTSFKYSYNSAYITDKTAIKKELVKKSFINSESVINQDKNIQNKSNLYISKAMLVPIDLGGLFICHIDKLKESVETALTTSNIKCFLTGKSQYKCEKSTVKFDLNISSLNKIISEEGYTINFKKKQGNNMNYKNIVNNICKKINEYVFDKTNNIQQIL